MPREDLIQTRRGTAAEWSSANPVLAEGELGSEIDTGEMKIGDGVTVWNSLPYVGDDVAGPTTPPVEVLTPTTGTVDLDMAARDGKYLTHALTGNVTYTTSNRAAGRSVTIKVTAGASPRTLTFPAWIFVGTEPADIAANKTGILTVTFFDTTDAAAVAAWAVEA